MDEEVQFTVTDEFYIKRYAHVNDAFRFIDDFEQELRRYWKWGEFKSEETGEFVERLWQTWHEFKHDSQIAGIE